jgi:hypothetical protein
LHRADGLPVEYGAWMTELKLSFSCNLDNIDLDQVMVLNFLDQFDFSAYISLLHSRFDPAGHKLLVLDSKVLDQEEVLVGHAFRSFVHLDQEIVEYKSGLAYSVHLVHDVEMINKSLDLHQHSLEEFDMEQCSDDQRVHADF